LSRDTFTNFLPTSRRRAGGRESIPSLAEQADIRHLLRAFPDEAGERLLKAEPATAQVTAHRHAEDALRDGEAAAIARAGELAAVMRALAESEKKLRLSTEAAELGIWSWDIAEDRVTWENDRLFAFFGLDRTEEPINAARFLTEFLEREDAPAFKAAFENTLRTGERLSFLGRIHRTDGELHWIEFTGQLTPAEEGKGRHMFGTAVVEMVRGDAQEKQLTIQLELAAKCRHLTGDPARLQQVFWNLLRNAVKFTPAGGSVSVRSFDGADVTGTEGESRVCIEVRDDGVGFEPAVAARIFEPFEQSGAGHRFGGLGLGLAIARAIVDLHRGAIRAESAGAGQGATFTVELPGAIDNQEQVGASSQNGSSGPHDAGRERSLRLLLVEDHEPTLQVLIRLLAKAGHQIVTARNIAEGRAAAVSATFDLVISDLGLPDGTGIELMSDLRATHASAGSRSLVTAPKTISADRSKRALSRTS